MLILAEFEPSFLHSLSQPSSKLAACTIFEPSAKRHSHRMLRLVQVVVATAPMCWGMTVSAQLVVIMGTQFYDSQGATGGEDYPVSDLLQMMGRASRPTIDQAGRCALCLFTCTFLSSDSSDVQIAILHLQLARCLLW